MSTIEELQEKANNTVNPLHAGLQLAQVFAKNPTQRVGAAIGWAKDEIRRKSVELCSENYEVIIQTGEVFELEERLEYNRRVFMFCIGRENNNVVN